MNIFSMVDDSPTRVFQTSASLTGGAFTAVELGENGVATAGATNMPIGILAAESELPIGQGEDVNVVIRGGAMWTAAESIKGGDMLASNANGKAVKATSGKFIFAQALGNANPDEAAHVLIIRGGKA